MGECEQVISPWRRRGDEGRGLGRVHVKLLRWGLQKWTSVSK
jgi:hypothetical protein